MAAEKKKGTGGQGSGSSKKGNQSGTGIKKSSERGKGKIKTEHVKKDKG